ncbi:MAG: hypothetical protein ACK5NK_03075 [Niabella sp.]
MKYISLITFFCLLLNYDSSAQKTNPTSKEEVEARQKQLQEQLDKLMPEQKK